MSTIQTQVAMVHIDSGLTASTGVQRTSIESAFSSDAISVTATPEALDLGDIVSVREVLVKLISGDNLLISLDGGTSYPCSLNEARGATLLPLESREVGVITCVADVADSLNGLYFDIEDVNGPVRVWFNVNAGTAPAVPTGGRLLEVAFATGAADTVVATAVAAAIDADAEFHCVAATATLTITDAKPGPRTDIAAGTSTFTGAANTGTTAVPSVFFKSLGTSQVVVAVAPN